MTGHCKGDPRILEDACQLASLEDEKRAALLQINMYISYLNTGMDVSQTCDHLYHLYREKLPDPAAADFMLILFERVREKQLQSSLFA